MLNLRPGNETAAPAGWVQTGAPVASVETAARRPVSVPTFGDHKRVDVPAYERRAQLHTAQRTVNGENFIEGLDVPAFLRRQAD